MTGPTPSNQNIDLIWGVKIPMRDGVKLNGTVYKPKQIEPTPVIFTLTPYIADSYHDRALYFARRGYAFVLVDCRGRGNSEGDFEPFVNEGPDGYDVVEWLAAQSWGDGQVAMWGGSYAGFNQWLTLKEFPPHLKTIVPAAAAHMGVDFPFKNNIISSYAAMQWLTFTSGVTPNTYLFEEQEFWIEKFRELYLNHLPFKDFDRVVGNRSTHFQTWLQHPTPDAYWNRMTLTPADYERIAVPVLTITGYYDGDQPGALHYYREHMKWGSPAGAARHFLLMGPWDHSGTRTPRREFGGLRLGQASLLDLNNLHREWYDWTLKDGPRPTFLKEQVAYYLMGAEVWKYAPSLEAMTPSSKRLYLNSVDGQANDVFHSGTLEERVPALSQPDHYVYDPLDVRPAELEREVIENQFTDQRYVLNLFGNGLIYHSQPFAEAIEIAGQVKVVVWIALDVPDTDFIITLSEITPDGVHLELTRALLRARYRHSLQKEALITPSKINRYQFEALFFFARRLARGSRLRLVLRSPNSIYLQKNYNGGGIVAEESAKDARTAHVTLYHDAEHPSYLELPVVS